jgi:predicted Zn-ribbon and HTH transcriptional regulator
MCWFLTLPQRRGRWRFLTAKIAVGIRKEIATPREKIEFVGPHIKVHSVTGKGPVVIEGEYISPVQCPDCQSEQLRPKDRIERRVRHASIGVENTWLHLTVRKYHCRNCGRYFRARVPGLLPYRKSAEMFRRESFVHHCNGISQLVGLFGRQYEPL